MPAYPRGNQVRVLDFFGFGDRRALVHAVTFLFERQNQAVERSELVLVLLFHGFFFDPVKLLQPDSVFNLFAHLNENRLVHARAAGFMKTRK